MLDPEGALLVGEVVAADPIDGLVVRTTIDPARQPFLDDHRIDGTPVLPGVMGMEAFAEVARLLVPGRHVAALEDVDFLAPVKFYRDEPRTLTITAALRPDGPDLVAECRLEAERVLPGSDRPQRTVHFTGLVRLTEQVPAHGESHRVRKADGVPVLRPNEVYRLYFHGPAYQVVAEAWRDDGSVAGRLAEHLPAGQEPAGVATVLAPRLEELCFQVAGLWEAGRDARLALPAHVDRLSLLSETAGREPAGVVALAHPAAGRQGVFDCEAVTADGDVLLRLEGYRTVAVPTPLADEVRAPLRDVICGQE
jgi:hypothetical protein